MPRARARSRPTTAPPTWAWPSRTCCAAAGHDPPPETSPTLPEVAAAFAAIEAASGPAAQVRAAARPARTVGPDDRQVHRQGARRRAADRPPRGPRRGGDRQGLRPAARRRQVGRDADRRRRPAGRRWPATTARRRRAGAVPPAQVHARLAGRGRGRDHRAGSAPRSGSRTSTTASAPSSTSAGRTSASTRATSTTSAASSRRSSRRPRPLPWDGILDGEILGWQDGHRPAVHRAPGAARAQVAVGRDPGRGAGHLRRLRRCWRSGPGDDGDSRSSRCCALPLPERRARLDALELPLVDRRRPVRPLAPRRAPPTSTRSRPPSPMRAAGATRA